MDIQTFLVNLWPEGSRFLARCLTTGIVSEGVTKEAALEHLRQGVDLRVKDSLPILKPVGPVGQRPWRLSSVSLRKVLGALEKAGSRLEAETKGHIKMVKLIDEERLRIRTVMIPRPAGDGELAVGSLNAIMEQTGMGRAEFGAVAMPEEGSVDLFLRLHLIPLADMGQENEEDV